MSDVLVTGATGTLGRDLVPLLRDRGWGARVMSRRPGAGRVVADLTTGVGLPAAVEGVSAVVHAATDYLGDHEAVDVGGTRLLAEACAAAGVRHLLYVSIVGIDRNPLPYYAAKLAAERVVARCGVPYSIERVSQFHDLVEEVLRRVNYGPVSLVPAGWSAQPVAVRDVAAHIGDRLVAGPSGAVTEFTGPERLGARALARARMRAGRRLGVVLPLPVPGRVARAFRMQSNIASPGAPRGDTTWSDWLSHDARR